jgi:putative membrane protein insertion efficiency factor
MATQGAAARTALRAINLYQRLSAHRPSPCRYIPSCSEYAREAVEVHGAGRGSWLTVRRLARCHPFGGQGFDPVPQPAAVRATTHEPRSATNTHGGSSC